LLVQATFIVCTSKFKKGFIAEPFENIQFYNLMCRVLGLTAAKNDGNLDAVQNILK